MSLFPERIIQFFEKGVLKRGLEDGIYSFVPVHIRDFGVTKHKKVDDYPFGGGAGMLLRVDVLTAALESIPQIDQCQIVYFSPKGSSFDKGVKKVLSRSNQHLVLICGAFEGIDERLLALFDIESISIGDVVVSSGDTVAIPFLDALFRRLPGVLGNDDSVRDESFEHNLLEYPHYTQPREFRGLTVPDVLLSGHHEHISQWRTGQSIHHTLRNRPDMLVDYFKHSSEDSILPSFSS